MSLPDEPAVAGTRDFFGGRLNLEQQKKRAKELLKAVRSGDGQALVRVRTQHPEAPLDECRLSDAQLVIARENGFASWPRMKAHIEALRIARHRIEAGRPLVPDTAETAHIRCGEDIRHSLEVAGFAGRFIEFSDPYCQGPVLMLDREAFIRRRTAFIVEAYGRREKETVRGLTGEYDAIDRLAAGAPAVLWFEHDSYDQLILARLLSHFSRRDDRPDLRMVCVGEVPGVPGFVGLGQLHPEVLLWLWEHELKPVTENQLSLGALVWEAIRRPDPTALARIAAEGTPALPLMAPALRRHLRELPSARTGLGLTQSIALSILADAGPLSAGRIYQALMAKREPLPYLGDLMFWHVLEELLRSADPMVEVAPESASNPWPQRVCSLTETGRRVLAGEVDFLSVTERARWVGGVEIRPRSTAWRWDEQAGSVLQR